MGDEKYALPQKPPPEVTDARPHKLTLLVSFVALIFSASAAVFAAIQAFEAHASRKIADQSAQAAERSAAAAEKSLTATMDAFRYDQRPIPSVVAWSCDRSADGSIRFSMTVKNNGKSDCIGLHRDIYITLNDRVIAQGEDLDTVGQTIPLGPFMEEKHELTAKPSPDQWRRVEKNRERLAVHLILSYHDALGSPPAKTGWCLYYAPDAPNKLLLCAP